MMRDIELVGYGTAHSLTEIFVLRKYRRFGLVCGEVTFLFNPFS